MLDRRLNVILYQPGLCGHFLQYLFGLDPSVYSLCGECDRRVFYSFQDLVGRYGSWHEHHRYHGHRFGWSYEQVDEFITRSHHPLAVIAVHPFKLLADTQILSAQKHGVAVHYYTVVASLDTVKLAADQFFPSQVYAKITPKDVIPTLEQRIQEHEYYQQSLKLQPMDYIDLDSIIDVNSFYAEYARVAELMAVPVVAEDCVREFYLAWRESRFPGLSV